MDGMEDGPPNGMNTVERLDILRKRRAAWNSRTLPFTYNKLLSVRHYVSGWIFIGNHIAWITSSSKLEVLRVPSAMKGVTEKSWTVEGFDREHLQTFMIEPEQDLLVLVKKR